MGILTREDGIVAQTPEEAHQLQMAGYEKCYNNRVMIGSRNRNPLYGMPCPFWLSPEAQHVVETQMGGYYTCPICHESYDLLQTLPEGFDPQRAEEHYQQNGAPGQGGTVSGFDRVEHGDIGEQIVHNLGEIPGYGPITEWHEGGAAANSPLDGMTPEWGIEVKTIDYGARNHRFIAGGRRPRVGEPYDEPTSKMIEAVSMGKKGVIGVLVLTDYRRAVADIYVKEFPADLGKIGHFRSRAANVQHLVAEVPFQSPYMDPAHPAPVTATPQGESAFAEQEAGMPF